MTPRFFMLYILVNIFRILTNLFETLIPFFRKTSVIATATLIAPLWGAFIRSLVKAHLLSTRAYNTFLILRQQLLHYPPSILNLKHLRHRPQNHIHRAGRHFSSQKPMIKWTLIRTSHIMMMMISCPRDQTNHVAMFE
jgi:hypothetical protein